MVFLGQSHKWLSANFAANNGGEIDYWVVGGGSAGCVAARVLLQQGYRVGVVEAGGDQTTILRPAEYVNAFGSDQDWGWKSAPQPALARRSLLQPRGRGPGGCTRINAMIWYPPRPTDWTLLQSTLDLQPEDLDTVTGWVAPESPRWLSAASQRFLHTRYPAVDPPHAFRRMTRGGRRTLASDLLRPFAAPLTDAAQSGRLQWIHAQVDRIEFAGDAAVAIHVAANGQTTTERLPAARGVILAAGALASPAILIRSGIGPADQLAELGIPQRLELPAVGSGLIDHLIMPLVYSVPELHRFPTTPSMSDLARWQYAGSGPLSSNLAESGGVYRLPRSADDRDTEYQVHVTPTHYLLHPAATAPAAMTIGVNLCRPQSRGSVRLTSAHWSAAPQVDPGYCSDPRDEANLLAAVHDGQRLAMDAAWQGWIGQPLLPAEGLDEDKLRRMIGRFAQTLYHPVATCRVGTSADGVVDRHGAVHGCQRLSVVDAAVLADIPSINPNATVMAVAHRLVSSLGER